MQESIRNDVTVSEFLFDCWKEENEYSLEKLDRYMTERVNEAASRDMVSLVAQTRYMELLEIGRASLQGTFTADELYLLLNAYPQPWWPELNGGRSCFFASLISTEYVGDDEPTPAIEELMRKLCNLDVLQQMALTDVFERAWRSQKHPVDSALEALS